MKKKKLIFSLIFIILTCVIVNFVREQIPFTIRQDRDNIVQVELLKKNRIQDAEFVVLCDLPQSEWDGFLNKLCGFDYSLPFGDGTGSSFGSMAVRITYSGGEYEIIGVYNNVYYTPQGKKYGRQLFSADDFRGLFEEYVEASLLPEWS